MSQKLLNIFIEISNIKNSWLANLLNLKLYYLNIACPYVPDLVLSLLR